jgi:hypothetical protein
VIQNQEHRGSEWLLLLAGNLPIAALSNSFCEERVETGFSGEGGRKVERRLFPKMEF